ncbi:hypothetical protein BOW53_11015 [Solemya pervernicosa gill symbiont]|uniref:DUF4124 domain-containing protein n=2 Tax=Gammaproteobacteria incertae sedis TaxID=118884 RepID=A0A1T2L3C5_9GAMM|nr:DUF4124 domain-containing protein [Candidatus Reidiella endopervernicosa]OOZ39569.1 hypothetical protein BOW53_11015 [Solemya pervernicosa gill symbiont]QKQ25657.1 DUF4124 domain-containing protein [Candidatus Reidiella endopervernicosa]
MMKHSPLIPLLLLVSSTSLAAGIYKWTDEQGNVHYGERPQGSAQEMKIETPRTPTTAPGNNVDQQQMQQRLLRSMEADRHEREAKRREAEKLRAERRAECKEAERLLQEYRDAGHLFEPDGKGGKRILSTEEREQATADLEKSIQKNCNG